MKVTKVFLLSPANCSGKRAQMILNEKALFNLALQVRSEAGAPLGDVFSFLSGLYFRGKISYARHFGQPSADTSGNWVITAGRGLQPAESRIGLQDLDEFAQVAIDLENSRYRIPLERDAMALAEQLSPDGKAVLLGSIATNKYTEILMRAFGDRLVFPREFVGRGDMSRGGLMLRCVDEGRELEYISVAGAVRHGSRPAKLEQRRKPLIDAKLGLK
jgi:hypothetical protein